jgi:hypothetical protein
MADPDESDAEKSGPHTDRNPGTLSPSAPVATESAVSHARPSLSTDTPQSSDTLLSAPLPAERELEERLTSFERHLAELTFRIETLERRPAAAPASSDRSYWFWLIFLAGLALAWQVLRLLH